MQKIKCPLSLYGECNEMAELAAFGEKTLSAQRGNKKYFLRCPTHGSLRFDKPCAQEAIKKAAGEPTENKPEIPQPKPEIPPEKTNDTEEEWGF